MSAHSIAGWIQGLAVVVTGVALGSLFGGLVGAIIGGLVLAPFALFYGRAVKQGEVYTGDAMGIWRFLLDATWSSLNTAAGAIYYGIHMLFGHTFNVDETRGTGSLWIDEGVSDDYATTIGTVKAGSNERIDDHEMIHVFQARLFGPLYLLLVGLNYVIATILPYWLLFKDRKPVSGFGSYFLDGVYPHVWNELWAYKYAKKPAPAPAPPTAPAPA